MGKCELINHGNWNNRIILWAKVFTLAEPPQLLGGLVDVVMHGPDALQVGRTYFSSC